MREKSQTPASPWVLFQRPARFGWLDGCILLVLVIVFLLPRLASLGRFVTADEPTWGKRASSFYYALEDGDFANTYQTGHPGVTTMWAGALAYRIVFPQYRDIGQVELGDTKLLQIFQNRGVNPLVLLAVARTWVALFMLAATVLSFLFAWRLFGRWLATLGFLLIAFEPFYLAHARFLHTNGMLAAFMFLSVLAYLDYLQSRKWYSLAVSGAAAGLSFITITPGFNLVPAVLVLTMFSLGKSIRELKARDWVARLVVPLALWGGISLLTIFIVWPAMWVRPVGSLLRIARYTLSAAEGEIGGAQFVEAYEAAYAAAGEDNSGYFYFYPLTYLWRTTPIILAGLLLGAFALIAPEWSSRLGSGVRRNLLLLLIYMAVYLLMMSLGGKKFDRYFLPAYLPLDMVAAAGWLALASWLVKFNLVRKYALQYLLLAGVVGFQATSALRTAPYYLTYYNPLLGGIRKAPAVMSIGWGEGLNDAAVYLKSKPGFCDQRIISWYTNAYNWYSASFGCDAQPVEFNLQTTLQEYLANYDYAVIYINQAQRHFPPQLMDYLDQQQPEHSVWIDGVEYARIYRLNSK